MPGGILVDEGPDQHAQAVTRTRELVANPDGPAIFEAAFAFDNVLIRADILQRLPSGAWRLAEVKSTTRVKPEHLHDLAIQAYVITGSGITLEQMQLVHVDTTYVRGENRIDWHAYFKPEDLTDEVRNLLASVPERVAEMHAVLGMPTAPETGRVATASHRLNANSGPGALPVSRRTGSSTCRVSTRQRSLSLTAMASSRCEILRRIFPSLPDSSGLCMPSSLVRRISRTT